MADGAERGELRIVEALDTQRKAIHAGGAVGSKACGLDRAWIGFERYFRIGQQRQTHADRRE